MGEEEFRNAVQRILDLDLGYTIPEAEQIARNWVKDQSPTESDIEESVRWLRETSQRGGSKSEEVE
ncbi:hypothetical protein JW766_05775 [Candidatus Dojkabacteria bacterium]|nr:hypothetical protein [Candidatus Dojkabacteria bacterium]